MAKQSPPLPPLPPLPRKSRARRAHSADETGGVTTYSIRLNEKERKDLEAVLQVTGWTPTYFITRAALDRAQHIVNTRTPRSFDYAKWARQIAQQLCDPIIAAESDGSYGEPEPVDIARVCENQHVSIFSPERLRAPDVDALINANGGSEFWRMILDECRHNVVDRKSLPDPIAPTTLG